MAQVSIRKVVKAYEGGVQAVKGIDLEIADHEFVVLVGPSGCGKSTTLRIIAGLEEITSGEIAIGGTVVNDSPPKDRDIAMVFQNYALYPHMSVYDNMAFGLTLRKFPKDEIRRRVENAGRILDITPLLERKPKALSGGQRQRVAMGRAIVRDPKVFLFDEPLSNLDAKLRVQMRTEIKRLRDRLRATTIYVTHDQVEAMTLADRIVVMQGGLVQQVGTPEEIYDRPATTFVASFMGAPAMNLLPGHIEAGRAVLPDGTALPIAQGTAEGPVTIGIRPERLAWLPPGHVADAAITGPAAVVEPLGSETLVTLDLAGSELHVRVPARSVRQAGEPVRLAVDPADIHLFSRDGARL